jgi:hypothetical protein
MLEVKLQHSLDNASVLLQKVDNTREEDIKLKARIQFIKELMIWPQIEETAAKTQRN